MQPQLLTKINFHPRCSNCNAEGESYTEYFHATKVQQEMYRGWNGVNGWFNWIESHTELSSILTRCEELPEDTEVILETDMKVSMDCGCVKRVKPETDTNTSNSLQAVAAAMNKVAEKKRQLSKVREQDTLIRELRRTRLKHRIQVKYREMPVEVKNKQLAEIRKQGINGELRNKEILETETVRAFDLSEF